MYDLCIIGGGAAGLSCAITAGRLGLKTLLIDKNNKLGKKLYATGNGRCNLTNMNFDSKVHFNSSATAYNYFIDSALSNSYSKNTPNQQIIEFMSSLGINTMEDNGYVYPSSAQASSVVWAMLDAIKSYDINVVQNEEVLSISGKYPEFTIKCKNEAFNAARIVLANGGAAYKSLGGSTSGYQIAKSLGHSVISHRPSLCGICVKECLDAVAGVRANAQIKLLDNNGTMVQTSKGELQITKQGVSGICIFELSSKAGRLLEEGINPILDISFIHSEDNKKYNQILKSIDNISDCNRTTIGFLNGYVNDKLAAYICDTNNISGKSMVSELNKTQLTNLVESLNSLKLHITSLYDMEQAQVTAGGVNINEINPKTMESLKVPGLYITGELLDIDGICGGYNLTFAILTGIKAGKSINDKNKSD